MKNKIFVGLLLVALVFGCTKPVVQETTQPVVTAPEPIEEVSEETLEEEEVPVIEPATPKCDVNIPSQNLNKIVIDNVTRTSDAFIFYIMLQDDKNNLMVSDGNIAMKVFSTKLFNNETVVGDYNLLMRSVGINKNEFKNCKLGPLIIFNSKIKASDYYGYIEPNDLGMLKVEFKRTGSNNIFEVEHWPRSKADAVLP